MKTETEKPVSAPEARPEAKLEAKPEAKDDLKSLPMPELQKKLGATPARPQRGRGSEAADPIRAERDHGKKNK